MTEVQNQNDFETAKNSLQELKSDLTSVVQEPANSEVRFQLGGGRTDRMQVVEDGTINFTVNGNQTCFSDQRTLGTVRYETDTGETVGYQANGVWRKDGDAVSIVSQPGLTYGQQTTDEGYRVRTLTYTLTNVNASESETPSPELVAEPTRNSEGMELLSCQQGGSTVTVGHVQNVTINISGSSYYQGWATFFENEFEEFLSSHPASPGDSNYPLQIDPSTQSVVIEGVPLGTLNDQDGDGIPNSEDNCPTVPNREQLDWDDDWNGSNANLPDKGGNACDDDSGVGSGGGGSAVNTPPTAVATVSNLTAADEVVLDGSSSTDPDGSVSSYSWSYSGPGSLNASGGSVVEYDPPSSVSSTQPVDVTLTVTDDNGATSSTTLVLTLTPLSNGSTGVNAFNNPPTAIAKADDLLVGNGSTEPLDGSSSFDRDGTVTDYDWTVVSGPGSVASDSATTTYQAPSGLTTAEEVRIELTVTDNESATATDTLVLTARPGANQTDSDGDGVPDSEDDCPNGDSDATGENGCAGIDEEGNALRVNQSGGRITYVDSMIAKKNDSAETRVPVDVTFVLDASGSMGVHGHNLRIEGSGGGNVTVPANHEYDVPGQLDLTAPSDGDYRIPPGQVWSTEEEVTPDEYRVITISDNTQWTVPGQWDNWMVPSENRTFTVPSDADVRDYDVAVETDNGGNDVIWIDRTAPTVGGGTPDVDWSESFDGGYSESGWEATDGELRMDSGGTDVVWESETIDISDASEVRLALDVRGFDADEFEDSGSAGDTLEVEYVVDGTTKTAATRTDDITETFERISETGIEGDQLRVRVRAETTAGNEQYAIDDVRVTSGSPATVTKTVPAGQRWRVGGATYDEGESVTLNSGEEYEVRWYSDDGDVSFEPGEDFYIYEGVAFNVDYDEDTYEAGETIPLLPDLTYTRSGVIGTAGDVVSLDAGQEYTVSWADLDDDATDAGDPDFSTGNYDVADQEDGGVDRTFEPGDTLYVFPEMTCAPGVKNCVNSNGNDPRDLLEVDDIGNDPDFERVDATDSFIDVLNATAGDRASAVSFDSGASDIDGMDLTNDLVYVQNEVDDGSVWPGGGTYLHRGLDEALDEYEDDSSNKRVMVVLTDGLVDSADYQIDDKIQEAQDKNVTVYSVGLSKAADVDTLTEIATDTGGDYYQVADAENLTETFEVVAGEAVTDRVKRIEHRVVEGNVSIGNSQRIPIGSHVYDPNDPVSASYQDLDFDPGSLLSLDATAYTCGDTVDTGEDYDGEFNVTQCAQGSPLWEVDNSSDTHKIFTNGDSVPDSDSPLNSAKPWERNFTDIVEAYNSSAISGGTFDLGPNEAYFALQMPNSSSQDYVVMHFVANDTSENATTCTGAGCNSTFNSPPTAVAEADDREVSAGGSEALDASASTDPDGSIADYQWTEVGSGPGSLTGADTATPSYDVPASYTGQANVTLELTVTDDDGATATDEVTLVADGGGSGSGGPAYNSPPTAIADADEFRIGPGNTTTLRAMASSNPSFDADGSIVDVQWSFASTPRGSIVSPDANTTTYQAPSSIGSRESVTVRLTVTDDDGATASTTVVLTLAPSGGSGSSSPGGGNGWVIGIGGGDVQIGDGDD